MGYTIQEVICQAKGVCHTKTNWHLPLRTLMVAVEVMVMVVVDGAPDPGMVAGEGGGLS